MKLGTLQIEASSLADYRLSPLSTSDDDVVREYVKDNWVASNTSRSDPLTDNEALLLILFARRMASLAVREKSTDRLHYGVRALLLEGGNVDFSESLAALVLLLDAATRIGINCKDFVRPYSAPPRSLLSNEVVNFAKRPGRERSIDDWGYTVVTDAEGFRYQRRW